MVNGLVHFEIQASDTKRAVNFYKKVFGWIIEPWKTGDQEYWLVMTTPKGHPERGINGGLYPRKGPMPKPGTAANAFICTVSVEDFDSTKEKIISFGGKVVGPKFEIETQMGKSWVGSFLDTEGNTFGVIENVGYIESQKKSKKKA